MTIQELTELLEDNVKVKKHTDGSYYLVGIEVAAVKINTEIDNRVAAILEELADNN